MSTAPDAAEILLSLRGILSVRNEDDVYAVDLKQFRSRFLDQISLWVTDHPDAVTRTFLHWLLERICLTAGVVPSSIAGFYKKKGEGKFEKVTAPIISLESPTFERIRGLFRAALETNTRSFLLEVEEEDKTIRFLAAALREGFTGPVFFQKNPICLKVDASTPDISNWKNLLEMGIYNVDLDASEFLQNQTVTLDERVRPMAEAVARSTNWIHEQSPEGIHIGIGSLLPNFGSRSTGVDDVRTFMSFYQQLVGEGKTSLHRIVIPYDFGRPMDTTTIVEVTKLVVSAYHLGGISLRNAEGFSDGELGRLAKANVAEIQVKIHAKENPEKRAKELFKLCGAVGTFEGVNDNVDAIKVWTKFPEACRKLIFQ